MDCRDAFSINPTSVIIDRTSPEVVAAPIPLFTFSHAARLSDEVKLLQVNPTLTLLSHKNGKPNGAPHA